MSRTAQQAKKRLSCEPSRAGCTKEPASRAAAHFRGPSYPPAPRWRQRGCPAPPRRPRTPARARQHQGVQQRPSCQRTSSVVSSFISAYCSVSYMAADSADTSAWSTSSFLVFLPSRAPQGFAFRSARGGRARRRTHVSVSSPPGTARASWRTSATHRPPFLAVSCAKGGKRWRLSDRAGAASARLASGRARHVQRLGPAGAAARRGAVRQRRSRGAPG